MLYTVCGCAPDKCRYQGIWLSCQISQVFKNHIKYTIHPIVYIHTLDLKPVSPASSRARLAWNTSSARWMRHLMGKNSNISSTSCNFETQREGFSYPLLMQNLCPFAYGEGLVGDYWTGHLRADLHHLLSLSTQTHTHIIDTCTSSSGMSWQTQCHIPIK